MGKIKQLFEQRNNAERLEACRQEINHALEIFKVHLLGFISVEDWHISISTGSSYWFDTFSTSANEKRCKAVS
jgi:hypothetical protein